MKIEIIQTEIHARKRLKNKRLRDWGRWHQVINKTDTGVLVSDRERKRKKLYRILADFSPKFNKKQQPRDLQSSTNSSKINF